MALRKLGPEVTRRDLGPVRMWRDDIAEMVAVFREAIPQGDVDIEVDGYKVDEIEDLAELKVPNIEVLTVEDRSEKVALELSTSRCLIKAYDPDLATRGMIAELAQIAERCRRRYVGLRILSSGFFGLVNLCIFFLLGVALKAIPVTGEWLNRALLLGSFGAVVSITAYVLVRTRIVVLPKSILFTGARAEAPTFWMRKRDDIWLTVIASLVSLILGGFLGYWINTIS
jgi:hypothetical protein